MSDVKFDFAIGNPPYQADKADNGRKPPVYNIFMDEAFKIADTVELITPARFLFNAGQTPKEWNKKMLENPHLKVLFYEVDGTKVFPSADIKGGIAITLNDQNKNFGEIGVYSNYQELNSILKNVNRNKYESISKIMIGAVPYKFTDIAIKENPDAECNMGKSFDLRTNILKKLDKIIFFSEKPSDHKEYVQIYGVINGKRSIRWVRRDYISVPLNFESYKVILPKANGSGAIGEVISTPLVGTPLVGHTQSFISIGSFDSEKEANACLKYVKSKFARTMLGILKITQDNPPEKWKYVPIQDFTDKSDINWNTSVANIDKQLYKKYGLSQEEIDFIETHVKEMV